MINVRICSEVQVIDYNNDDCDDDGSIMSSLDSLIMPIRSSNEIHLLYAAILRGGIIDIVNSTNETSKISNPNKLKKYYSLFLNTLPSTINSCNGNIIKTIGDSLFFYFPNTR